MTIRKTIKTNEHGTKSLIKLLSSTIFVQFLAFLFIPFLARIYTKTDYGVFVMLMSIASIIGITANGRYDQAVFVSGRRRISSLFLLEFLGTSINILLSLLVLLLCVYLPFFLDGTGYEAILPYRFFIPLMVLSSGAYSMLVALNNVEARYNRISLAQIVQGLLNNLMKLGLGLWKFAVWGLVLAFNFAQIIASFFLVRPERYTKHKRQISLYRLKVVAWYYRAFPMFNIGRVMIEMLMANLLILFLPNYYAVEEIGLLGMLFMLTRRPIQAFSDSISKVYGRRFVESIEERKPFLPVILRLTALILLSGLALYCLLPYCIEVLISYVIGDQWLRLGAIILSMLPYLLMMSAVYIFNFIPDVLHKQAKFLIFQTIRFVYHMMIVFFLPTYFDFEGFLALYYSISAVEFSLYMLWFIYLVRKSDQEIAS